MKRKVSLFLTFILMLTTIFSVNVFASSYPSISSSKYIEFKAQQNINVYKDTSCKTRGTSSPSKEYNASISNGDTCYIYEIEKNYIQVNYPTSSGRRTGYIKRNALFDTTAPVNYISSSKAKVTIHKSSSGSCVAKGDKVWEVDTKKEFSGYKAVIYEAKSGKRAYKLGYVTNNDLEKIKKESESTKTNNTSSNDKVTTSYTTKISDSTYTKTITVPATSLEDWCEKISYAERSMTALGTIVPHITEGDWWRGNIIVGRQILSTKRVKVRIPDGRQGPNLNSYKEIYVELPYKIKYTLHKHNYENKITEEYFGKFLVGLVNQEIVHTQTCECGLSKSAVWQIPDMVVDKVTAGETYKVESYISAGK